MRCFPAEPLSCLAASPDGALLAGGTPSGALTLWLVSTGHVLRTWQGHHKGVASLAFSHDASWLVTGGQDTSVCVWLTPTGASLCPLPITLSSPAHPPLRCAVLGSSAGAGSVEAAHTWQAHTLPVTCVSCGHGMASQLVVSSSLDRTCVVWTLTGGGVRLRTLLFPVPLTCCALDPCDWALFAGAVDGRIFTAPVAGEHASWGDAPAAAAAPGPDGLPAYGGAGAAAQLVGHTHPVRCVAHSADGTRLVSCGDDGALLLWCSATHQVLRRLAAPQPAAGGGGAPLTHALLVPRAAASAMAAGEAPAGRGAVPSVPLAKYQQAGERPSRPWEGPPAMLWGHPGEGRASGEAPGHAALPGGGADAVTHALTSQLAQARDEAARWKALHGQLRALVAEET